MRIGRLDLIRYGRFTERALTFPRGDPDIHFVYGPNEAGKSTSLAAIEDLLFGFAHSTPYDFIHEKSTLRIGATLEQDGRSLEVLRRKGNKDTLLAPDGTPLAGGDGALASILGAATQEFFVRMMSLNHERLARGGQELLEPGSELGQMLFSAGTGLSGLREQLSALQREADELWGPRRAGHRKYYIALDGLLEAERAQREHTVTAAKWGELKKVYDEAQAAHDALLNDIQTRSVEQRKLSRIRRVYRAVRELTDLEQELTGLGEPTALPDDARSRLTGALDSQTDAQSKLSLLAAQLAQLKAERAGLQCDATLLGQAEAIEQLHQRRIQVQKERSDLPKRQAELTAKEDELREHADALGWDSASAEAIRERLPSRAHVSEARALLNQRGEHLAALKGAREAHAEAEERLRELRDAQGGLAKSRDLSALSASLSAARGLGDIRARIEAAESSATDCDAGIGARLQVLRPALVSETRLADMPVPPRAALEAHRDALRKIEQQASASRERLKSAEREIARLRQTYEQRGREHDGLAPEALRDAREKRDAGWRLIRRRFIDGEEVSQAEIAAAIGTSPDLPGAYEARVRASDILADRRFELAQAAGEIAVLSRQIRDQELELAKVRDEERDLSNQREALETSWRELWSGTDIEPLPPDFMLEWLTARGEILALIESREAARRQASESRQKELQAKSCLLAELEALGEDIHGLRDRPLSVALEQGSAAQQRQQAIAAERARLEDQIRRTEADVGRKGGRLQDAQREWSQWQTAWSAAVTALGLSRELSTEAATDRIETLERMRVLLGEMTHLRRERIAKIEQDIGAFETAARTLVRAIAPDLGGRDPDAAALAIESRLAGARQVREEQRQRDASIKALEKRVSEFEQARNNARETIELLQRMAGVSDLEGLNEAIRRAARRRELASLRSQIETRLAAEGDGLPLTELRGECEGVDLDRIASQEERLQKEIESRQKESFTAAERLVTAQAAFAGLGGDGAAAKAAAERQEALASLRNVAERYVRIQTSATVLRWAIDRFRRERQAPLVSRAGSIFAELTSGAFSGLRVEYDDQDRARLTGVRADRSSVPIPGMSDGTADQLYLALRLASVEEHLSTAHALPFIADDLLLNFDDERAAAALKVLARMGRRTQVLFFTHHRHLVELASEVLGSAVSQSSLVDGPSRSRD